MRNQSTVAAMLEAVAREAAATGLLGAVVRSIISSRAFSDGTDRAKATALDTVRRLAIGAAAFLVALLGTGMLVAAAYFVLERLMGAVAAFAILGALLWLIAMTLLLYGLRSKPKPAPANGPTAEEHGIDLILEGVSDLTAEVKRVSGAHPFLAVAAAFGVGMILAQIGEAPRGEKSHLNNPLDQDTA